ncbi:helix-turn-helix transcriptional regulator [Methylobacterium sp. E-045]|uniref:helix-turn-helix transcriptional regulator n=1 Tax=Methylobacterium sp. E-045 TaxID=2836575 RepID=UPI001FBB679C|nr:helix-turn-helix domain-containing protein [Methylobacterium sp. E-045]MCJ2130891.1 helix-turn-helix domain-containing protein [Methylobacterium sp. E-045]
MGKQQLTFANAGQAVTDRHDLALHTQAEAATLLRISERSLERHRVQGTGPRYASLGRRIVYARADLLAWVQACSRCSTSEPRR